MERAVIKFSSEDCLLIKCSFSFTQKVQELGLQFIDVNAGYRHHRKYRKILLSQYPDKVKWMAHHSSVSLCMRILGFWASKGGHPKGEFRFAGFWFSDS